MTHQAIIQNWHGDDSQIKFVFIATVLCKYVLLSPRSKTKREEVVGRYIWLTFKWFFDVHAALELDFSLTCCYLCWEDGSVNFTQLSKCQAHSDLSRLLYFTREYIFIYNLNHTLWYTHLLQVIAQCLFISNVFKSCTFCIMFHNLDWFWFSEIHVFNQW